MKRLIRAWLIRFLGIEETLKLMRKENIELRIENKNLKSDVKDIIRKSNKKLKVTLARYDKLFHMGVDTHISNPCKNWAVICINGKPNTVKFLDLSHVKTNDINKFIKSIKATNRGVVIDAHPNIHMMSNVKDIMK